MDLLKYEEFKSDVEFYLKEIIDKYNLRYNEIIMKENFQPKENYAAFENKFCRIIMNNIESFPYPDIISHYYLLNGKGDGVEVLFNDLLDFIKIDNVQFEIFCKNHYQQEYENSNEFMNLDKGCYLYGILFTKDVINKFYYPLFIGASNYDEYNEFILKKIRPR